MNVRVGTLFVLCVMSLMPFSSIEDEFPYIVEWNSDPTPGYALLRSDLKRVAEAIWLLRHDSETEQPRTADLQ